MISSKAHDLGQKLAIRSNAVLSQDAVKLLKTQDAGYLKAMFQKTRKVRERLEQQFTIRDGDDAVIAGGKSGQLQNRHMYFVETVEVQKQFNADVFPGSKGTGCSPVYHLSRVEQDDLEENEEEMDKGQSQPRKLGKRSSSHQRPKEDALALRNNKVLQKLRKSGEEARVSRLNLLKLRERELLAAERELELQRAKMGNSVRRTNKSGAKWKPRERRR